MDWIQTQEEELKIVNKIETSKETVGCGLATPENTSSICNTVCITIWKFVFPFFLFQKNKNKIRCYTNYWNFDYILVQDTWCTVDEALILGIL